MLFFSPRKKRLKALSLVLGSPRTPEKELSIITMASADPKLAPKKSTSLIYATIPTVIDAVAFASFINRAQILNSCSSPVSAAIFTHDYFLHIGYLISYALGLPSKVSHSHLNNRIQLFETAFTSTSNSRTSALLDLFAKLMASDCYSDTFTPYNTPDEIPLTSDVYLMFHSQTSSNAYFDSFPDFFSSYISAVGSIIDTY